MPRCSRLLLFFTKVSGWPAYARQPQLAFRICEKMSGILVKSAKTLASEVAGRFSERVRRA